MSLFAAAVYGWLNEPVVLCLTGAMYAVGLAYFFAFAQFRLVQAAPEELTARSAAATIETSPD